MASNPMQRKSRNSFLLGIIVTLLITGVVIAFLLLMLKQKDDQIKAEQEARVTVYTLTQNVKAAQILTQDMFMMQSVNVNTVPSNATSTASVIESWFLQTKEGEQVCTDKNGLYLNRANGDKAPDTIIEIFTNTENTIEDSKGNKIENGECYVEAGGVIEKVNSTSTKFLNWRQK